MYSVSLLLSPGPTLNSCQRVGLWGREAAAATVGAGETPERMLKESELVCTTWPSSTADTKASKLDKSPHA